MGVGLKGAGFTRCAVHEVHILCGKLGTYSHLLNLKEAFDTIFSVVASDATLFHSAPRRLAEARQKAQNMYLIYHTECEPHVPHRNTEYIPNLPHRICTWQKQGKAESRSGNNKKYLQCIIIDKQKKSFTAQNIFTWQKQG